MKHLAIFDIDGTLSNTVGLDDDIYRNTLNEYYNLELNDLEWNNIKILSSGTDSGIFNSIFHKYLGNLNFDNEVNRFKSAFTHYLRLELFHKSRIIEEVEGAKSLLNELKMDNDIVVAIATGSWKYSGILKLQSIKIDVNSYTYGNSELHFERNQIINDVILNAKIKNKKFKKITYFGDGVWDSIAAEKLNINFVGVDSFRDDNLKKYNVKEILYNYSDIDRIKSLIRS
jgi:phosphoglycolate phosphatase-like HAD superfamily hydrolase